MLLLDTHIWIRWQNAESGAQALPDALIERIETADRVAISAISCWELGQLVKRQRVQLSMSVDDWITAALEDDVQVLAIDRRIAGKAAALPEYHRDPADRLIIATTLVHDACLISLDAVFPQYRELADRLIQY